MFVIIFIVSNTNYVKKVVFPLEILPSVAIGSALFHAGISLVVLLTAQLLINQRLPWTVVVFPMILLPLLLATTGFAWLLSALGVYLRDVAQTTSILTTVLMFLSPLFYPLSALPEPLSSPGQPFPAISSCSTQTQGFQVSAGHT